MWLNMCDVLVFVFISHFSFSSLSFWNADWIICTQIIIKCKQHLAILYIVICVCVCARVFCCRCRACITYHGSPLPFLDWFIMKSYLECFMDVMPTFILFVLLLLLVFLFERETKMHSFAFHRIPHGINAFWPVSLDFA